MKMFLASTLLAVGLTAFSQSAGNDPMESQIQRGLSEKENGNLITLQTEKANEIRHGRIRYNGIFVQLVKTDNPLQLINPAAPPEYGSSRDNLVVDPNNGPGNSSRQGLKLFSINF